MLFGRPQTERIFAKYFGPAAGRAIFSLSSFGPAAGRAKFSLRTFGPAAGRAKFSRYGAVRGGTGQYGAVRGGTGRYASGPAQPFNFAFGRYAGPVEQQEEQQQQQEQGKKIPFRS